jgi:hypothetical protein
MLKTLMRMFLPKDEKAVMDIFDDLDQSWKNTNDFLAAHAHYLKGLDDRHNLNLGEEKVMAICHGFATSMLSRGLSQSNAMYNFAQFVYYVIFGWNKPNAIRQDDEQIFDVIENIDRFLKKAETDMGGYKLVLDKSKAERL